MKETIRFIYLRDERKQPVSCVAVLYTKTTKTITYGISTLNPADTFNRKMAREVATGRLNEKPSKIELYVPDSDITAHFITRKIIQDLLLWDRDKLPRRTKKAAELWVENTKDKESKEKKTERNEDYITM